jgi:hypothetical protein
MTSTSEEKDGALADYIRDQVCCPRIHGCELGGSEECPAERVRAALQAAEQRATKLAEEVERLKNEVRHEGEHQRKCAVEWHDRYLAAKAKLAAERLAKPEGDE